MSGLEDPGIIVIIIVAFAILLIELFIYLTRMARTGESDPEQSQRHEIDDSLLSTIRSGFHEIVTRSADFQEQISFLQIAITINAAAPGALEQGATRKFNENSQKIDQLSEQYSLVMQDLVELFHEETIITSEHLRDHRLKEVGIISELSDLSNRIKPLLEENITIITPVINGPEGPSFL